MSRLMLWMMYPVSYCVIVFGPRTIAAWLGLPADDIVVFAMCLTLGLAEVLLIWELSRDIRANWFSRALAKRVGKGSSRGLDDAWLDGPT